MKAIGITSFKGGVGKTATSVSLAAGIKIKHPSARVLLIDTDPQGSLRACFGFRLKGKADFADFLIDGTPPELGFHEVRTEGGNIDLFLTSSRLGQLEEEIKQGFKRDELLKHRMKKMGLAEKYDYIIIDTSPAMGLMNINVFTFVNYILIPVNLDIYALPTIESVLGNLNSVAEFFDEMPTILGILPTKIDRRSTQEKKALEIITQRYGDRFTVFPGIGVDSAIKRSSVKKQTIYDINSRASAQYAFMTSQVLERING